MIRKMPTHNLQLFLLLLPLTFWVVTQNELLDLHLYDTYYVMAPFLLVALMVIVILAEAGIYFATRKYRQWRGLHYFHLLSFTIFIIALFFTLYRGNGVSMRYYEAGNPEKAYLIEWVAIGLSVTFLIFALGQLAFVINVIAGFFRGKKAPL